MVTQEKYTSYTFTDSRLNDLQWNDLIYKQKYVSLLPTRENEMKPRISQTLCHRRFGACVIETTETGSEVGKRQKGEVIPSLDTFHN